MPANKKDIIVKIYNIIHVSDGCCVFIGNENKIFNIHVSNQVGKLISDILCNVSHERPQTHTLLHNILNSQKISVNKVLIHNFDDEIYYAKITLEGKITKDNTLIKHITEIDCRPSDAIILALINKKEIFVAPNLLEKVTDVSKLLKTLNSVNQGSSQ